MRALASLAVLLAAAGCATPSGAPSGAPRGAPELGVEFSWAGVPACSSVSPRIVVRDAPAGTTRFRVALVDVDSALSRHGGGEVAAAPGGVIPAGALKSYRGPCPAQQPVVYEMRVAALDAAGRVIAEGRERRSIAPRSLLPRRR